MLVQALLQGRNAYGCDRAPGWRLPAGDSTPLALATKARVRHCKIGLVLLGDDEDEDEEDEEDEEDAEEALENLKFAVKVAHMAGDSASLFSLASELEALNPSERCATSPLLDGYWETIYASAPAAWTGGGRVRHIIEWAPASSESGRKGVTALGPGAPGILAGIRGEKWDDVAEGRGAYVQRSRRRFGSSEVRATYTWLGGEAWDIRYVSRARLLFGIPIWKRRLGAPECFDLDYAVRPTFVDGELCVMRAPAVSAGDAELRGGRVYILKRMRNRLWQDGSFTGLSDKPVLGFELEP